MFLITYSLSLTTAVRADDISISASVDKNVVSINDQIVLEIDVSGTSSNLPNPDIPQLTDFNMYSSGRSQNVSIINGQVSSSIVFKYVLVPKTIVKTTIPPITLNYNGKIYQTQRIPVDVVQSAPSQNNAPRQQGNYSGPQEQNIPETGDDLFLVAEVDKKNAYVNEQITYSLKFYRRIDLLSQPGFTPSDFSGFWSEDFAPKNYNAVYKGRRYLITELKTLLFPTKPGKFTLKEASLTCQIPDYNSADFFGGFFSQGRTKIIQSKPITINVNPLPEANKPKGFNGTVGQYSITADIDKKTVKVNEPVTLNILVSGTGNIKAIAEPQLPDWPDFKKYETVGSLNINKDSGVLKGNKTFTTVIVPQTPGNKTIEPISFPFFDPDKKQYVNAQTPSFKLLVKPGPQIETNIPEQRTNDIKIVNKDIRFIKTLANYRVFEGYIYTKAWFKLVNLAPVFIFGFVFIYVNWQEKLNKDIAYARSLRASGTSKKYLKKAVKLLNLENSSEFYNAISRAIVEYIANKTNVSAESLTSSIISAILSKKEIKAETIAEVNRLLEECAMVRFAPSQVTESMMREIYQKTAITINKLEKEL